MSRSIRPPPQKKKQTTKQSKLTTSEKVDGSLRKTALKSNTPIASQLGSPGNKWYMCSSPGQLKQNLCRWGSSAEINLKLCPGYYNMQLVVRSTSLKETANKFKMKDEEQTYVFKQRSSYSKLECFVSFLLPHSFCYFTNSWLVPLEMEQNFHISWLEWLLRNHDQA